MLGFNKKPSTSTAPANTTEPSPLDPTPRTPDTHKTFSRLASAKIERDAAKTAMGEANELRIKREQALRVASREEEATHARWQQCRADFDRRADHEEAVERRRQAEATPDPYPHALARHEAALREVAEAEEKHAWTMFKEREPALHKVTSGEDYRERTAPLAAQFVDALETLERVAAEIDAAWCEALDAGRHLNKNGRPYVDFCERQRIGPVMLELVERGGPTSGTPSGDEIPYTGSLVDVVRGVRRAVTLHTSGRAATTGEQREKDVALLRRMFAARVPHHVLVDFEQEGRGAKAAEEERAYQVVKSERARKRAEAEAAREASERESAEAMREATRIARRTRGEVDDAPPPEAA